VAVSFCSEEVKDSGGKKKRARFPRGLLHLYGMDNGSPIIHAVAAGDQGKKLLIWIRREIVLLRVKGQLFKRNQIVLILFRRFKIQCKCIVICGYFIDGEDLEGPGFIEPGKLNQLVFFEKFIVLIVSQAVKHRLVFHVVTLNLP
jgi:hypothetical protein